MNKKKKENREDLSDYAHDAWSRWMKHIFDISKENEDGTITIPKGKVNRWKRQMNTPYEKLTKNEKESDREEADKMLDMIKEENIKVQVDRETASLPRDRKALQQFGQLWKKVYSKLKTSPDKVMKYKGIVKKISNIKDSLDNLAGVFEFMGRKFKVYVNENKYRENFPTPWNIAFVSQVNEHSNHVCIGKNLRQTIKEEIISILLEGGNLSDVNSVVPQEYISSTIENGLNIVNMNKLKYTVVGNKNKSFLGDVDVAVDSKGVAGEIGYSGDDPNQFWFELGEYLDKQKKLKSYKISKGLNQFSLVVPLVNNIKKQVSAYKEDGTPLPNPGFVQLDIFIGDLKWMKQALSASNPKSDYKAVYRNLFLVDILSQLSFKTKDQDIKRKLQINWKEGVEVVDYTYDEKGRRKKLKIKKIIGNMDKFAKFLFGKQFNFRDIDSFEKLYILFKSKHFHFPKLKRNIIDAYKKTLKKHKLPLPREIK